MDILKFITAGSVDDGKSTLIGRLLYDTKNILADQLDAVERASKNKNNGERSDVSVDLALLTDGLRSEREQGITIDVAYKYFQTNRRKFISIDAPGHIQYTRNMVTGASNADLAIILVDARQGVVEQTRRHSLLVSLLNIPNAVVAINKMDLVGYSEDTFLSIAKDYEKLSKKLNIKHLQIIPVSALAGDNIVDASTEMPWYSGPTLLDYLENVAINDSKNLTDARFMVQYVLRPQTEELHDYRGYAGVVQSGIFSVGDAITVYPSERTSRIAKIEQYGNEIEAASAGMSITLLLTDDVDISRGDLVVGNGSTPKLSQDIEATICWMDDRKDLAVGQKYTIQHGTTRLRCSVRGIDYKVDINTYDQIEHPEKLKLNDIAKIQLRTAQPLAYDVYNENPAAGAAILIDETSNVTVAACMIE
jgi:sulfate adenylyltransferase subunit 1